MVRSAIPSDASALAVRIRRQRQALRLSLAETAEMAGVSTGFLSMLENNVGHQPGYDRVSRIASALGLGVDVVDCSGPLPEPRSGLAAELGACLAVKRRARLADLTLATGAPLVAVRMALRRLHANLSPCGMRVVDSGYEAELQPLPGLAAAASLVAPCKTAPMTEARMMTLAIVAAYGVTTRKAVEEIRGLDSVELLAGLVGDGYLEVLTDDRSPGAPYTYRLTPRVLEEIGMDTIEEMRTVLHEHIGGAGNGG